MAVTTESRRGPRSELRTEKGISLARGPALILGTILLAVGLYFLYKQHTFPKFSNFSSGTATVKGKVLFNLFGGNGWTGMLTAICGGLLLFGAAQHLLAKTMSLIVGAVLAAAAIIALLDHGNVLGLVSANHLTELAWGIAAVILLFNTLIPRRTRTVEPVYDEGAVGRRGGTGRVAAGAAAGAGAGALAEHEHDRHRDRGTAGERGVGGRGENVDGERGHGGRHAVEAGAVGAGAGALAEHEHDRHREERAADAGEPATGRGEAAGGPVADRGAQNQPAAGDTAATGGQGVTGGQGTTGGQGMTGGQGATGSEDATSVQNRPAGRSGGGQVGLAERARRWLRPGSSN